MAQHVVIVGGGFGGLTAAQELNGADVEITLIDRTNHHLFQPLLYQVATGGLSPADIASPIRYILRRQRNVRVIEDTVREIEADRVVTDSATIPFDQLIVATGATHHYFGNDQWEDHAPGLKTLPDATRLRAQILGAFEQAERTGSADITFLVVGAGPTGVEMAGAIAEMARHTLRRDFRAIDPAAARVLLVEAGPRVLAAYPEKLSRKAERQLVDLGVEVMTDTTVTEIGPGRASLVTAEGEVEVEAQAVVWAAGVRASSLGEQLATLGADLDRAGRVRVDEALRVPGHQNLYVIGDLAAVEQDGKPVPGVAPAAMQMGSYVADRIRGMTEAPFTYRDKGSLATIGRSAGIADFGRIRFSGFPAWAAWLGIHIFFLIGFQNRILVMIQWAWSYFTRNRSARLIVRYDRNGR
ncbi:MAG: NAD(P)/FAD-dependent oxidoreductase [Acidimicrobiia bacterium]|nr:NAD(P)/FAD-dependent oxidoreductase [Acidimicrobiia bacterium]